jgi:hypothetical protein
LEAGRKIMKILRLASNALTFELGPLEYKLEACNSLANTEALRYDSRVLTEWHK